MNLTGILDIAYRSDPGRLRPRNEDCVRDAADIGVVALADGMGGYNGGEIASAMAVDTIVELLRARVPALAPGERDTATDYTNESLAVRQAITHANKAIYQAAQTNPQYLGMGTTVVVGIFYDNQVTVAHVGDSRMYRLRANRLEQLTVDHSLFQELVDRGVYTLREARKGLSKNLVTRALGIETTVAVDIHEDRAEPGDVYMLCSDGLTGMIDDREIQQTLQRLGGDLEQAAAQLVGLANDNGGKDNISVLLVRPNYTFPSQKRWHQKLIDWI